MKRLHFAVVCASNQNRSMEAHAVLKKNCFNVDSYGVGTHVKLPGPTINQPNVYSFGTPYEDIYNDLLSKDPDMYNRNGLLKLLQRNMTVKRAPEKFQECKDEFDVIITFEERVLDQVLEDLESRTPIMLTPVLIINMDVKDTREEAATAAEMTLRLCTMLEAAQPWEIEASNVISRFFNETGKLLTATIRHY
uniref:RNA polymerase II subunit A C-terminal domain phosphatase SSU72 n=1 Tax=Polytomella parva TaxID=51329 RepID=A0A7S0UVB1_9CHLO|mmetsp:Transcript_1923/g.2849  ORF Transcript_1923/g.2849 Transcript_1923/m.2849 type:complete len:193 (+) Transcript_1923:114-692(+)